MPRAAAVAVGGLAFAALFLSDGSSQSRLFWIGAAAVIVAAVGWAVRPPVLSREALAFFGLLALFVAWEGASIEWSIQPSGSWDYANRGLVYLAFAAAGALVGGIAPRRLTYAAAVLLGALFVWALAAKGIGGLYSDYGRLAWVVGACVAGVGLLLPGVSDDGQPHHVRVHDGLLFGAALVGGAAVVLLALRFAVTRAVQPRLVRAPAAVLVALLVAAFAASVVSAGGPVDFVRDRWHEFNNPASAQLANSKFRV